MIAPLFHITPLKSICVKSIQPMFGRWSHQVPTPAQLSLSAHYDYTPPGASQWARGEGGGGGGRRRDSYIYGEGTLQWSAIHTIEGKQNIVVIFWMPNFCFTSCLSSYYHTLYEHSVFVLRLCIPPQKHKKLWVFWQSLVMSFLPPFPFSDRRLSPRIEPRLQRTLSSLSSSHASM